MTECLNQSLLHMYDIWGGIHFLLLHMYDIWGGIHFLLLHMYDIWGGIHFFFKSNSFRVNFHFHRSFSWNLMVKINYLLQSLYLKKIIMEMRSNFKSYS